MPLYRAHDNENNHTMALKEHLESKQGAERTAIRSHLT